MKFVLSALAIIIFVSFFGCLKERRYVYPTEERLEIQRICRFVKAADTNRFMVLLGKIYPLNNDGTTSSLERVSTTLEDAGYFCGNFRLKNYPCSSGKNKIFDQEDCIILR